MAEWEKIETTSKGDKISPFVDTKKENFIKSLEIEVERLKGIISTHDEGIEETLKQTEKERIDNNILKKDIRERDKQVAHNRRKFNKRLNVEKEASSKLLDEIASLHTERLANKDIKARDLKIAELSMQVNDLLVKEILIRGELAKLEEVSSQINKVLKPLQRKYSELVSEHTSLTQKMGGLREKASKMGLGKDFLRQLERALKD